MTTGDILLGLKIRVKVQVKSDVWLHRILKSVLTHICTWFIDIKFASCF